MDSVLSDVATAKKSVSKSYVVLQDRMLIKFKQIAMEQRARVMGKTAEATIYRSFGINSMKKKTRK